MIVVTGHKGYIGTVLTELLLRETDVKGMDCGLYAGSETKSLSHPRLTEVNKDIRELREKDFEGADAVVHLAALSNDPLGELRPGVTEQINFEASVRLARLAKAAGVRRFVFSSSCSVYGIVSGGRMVCETDPVQPLTAYARSKVRTEEEVAPLSDGNFHPVFLRNATAYGVSPSLRLDLVVNNLVGSAVATGRIDILSDGTPWRPLVHVRDLCQVIQLAIRAPEQKIHCQTVNVGVNTENYRVRQIADCIAQVIPGCQVAVLSKTGSDERSYQVDFSKLKEILPDFKPQWNLERGVREIFEHLKMVGLDRQAWESPRYFRIRWLKQAMAQGKLAPEFFSGKEASHG